MRRLLWVLTFWPLVQPMPAKGAEMTVGDLQELCTGADDASKAACRFYILGVTEGTSLAAGISHDAHHFCTPEGVTISSMEFVVKKAIGEDLMFYPEDKKMGAAGFVGAAMVKAFPCR